MAELAGDDLTRGAIYLFETGRARPSEDVLNLIATRTGRPLVFFRSPRPGGMSAQEVARLDNLVAAGRAAEALELGGSLLGTASEVRLEARLRLQMARAALALDRVEAGLLGARQARRLAAGDGDLWLAVEAGAVEVEALRRGGDPGALALAAETLAEARAMRPAPPGIELELLRATGAIHAQRGDWPAAAEAYRSLLAHGAGAGAMGEAIDALEAEARRQAGRGGEAEVAAFWQATALRAWRARAELSVDAAIALAGARAEMGDAAAARDALVEAGQLAAIQGLDGHRSRALLELAALELREERRDQAAAHVGAVMALAEAAGDRRALGAAHLLAGRLASAAGDHDRAVAELRQALADLEAAGDIGRLLEARWAYAEVLEARGDIREALEQWKLATGLARPDLLPAARVAGGGGDAVPTAAPATTGRRRARGPSGGGRASAGGGRGPAAR
jgi:tetratricopeptide (TPR) repeat protein